jgi:hypothetical protein
MEHPLMQNGRFRLRKKPAEAYVLEEKIISDRSDARILSLRKSKINLDEKEEAIDEEAYRIDVCVFDGRLSFYDSHITGLKIEISEGEEAKIDRGNNLGRYMKKESELRYLIKKAEKGGLAIYERIELGRGHHNRLDSTDPYGIFCAATNENFSKGFEMCMNLGFESLEKIVSEFGMKQNEKLTLAKFYDLNNLNEPYRRIVERKIQEFVGRGE